jgi:hypothetical protein
MALDQIARGMLEKHIDAVIDGIPYLISRVRNKGQRYTSIQK